MKLQKTIAAALVAATAGTTFAEGNDMDKLQQMRLQPTVNIYNIAMNARQPEGVLPDDQGIPSISLTSVQLPRPRKYRKHDLVQILVRQDSEATSDATTDQNRKQDYDIALQQFLEFARYAGTLGIGNVANPGKLPEIKFKFDNSRNAQSSVDRRDHMAMRLTAEIVDVKPNGTLVLEAVSRVRHDREELTMRLSGIARAEDIQPDNTIISSQLANLNVSKDTIGEVRDGTKRSWINKFIDRVGP